MKSMKLARCFICTKDVHLAVQYQNFSYPEEGCWPGRHDVFVTKNGRVNQVCRKTKLFLHKTSKAQKWTRVFRTGTCWTIVQSLFTEAEHWGVSWLSRKIFKRLWQKNKNKRQLDQKWVNGL